MLDDINILREVSGELPTRKIDLRLGLGFGLVLGLGLELGAIVLEPLCGYFRNFKNMLKIYQMLSIKSTPGLV